MRKVNFKRIFCLLMCLYFFLQPLFILNSISYAQSGEDLNSDEQVSASGRLLVSSGEIFEEENLTLTENLEFTSGVFTTGKTGKILTDFVFDGGGYKGELAIFSLNGMRSLSNPEEFIEEAAKRALSESEGFVIISDIQEGARFDGPLNGDGNHNSGPYMGFKSFWMQPYEEFGVMLVPDGTVQEVYENPDIGGKKRPLFSMATSNPEDIFYYGQIGDITGGGKGFAIEDQRMDEGHRSDKDYNDIIFKFNGASGEAPQISELLDPKKDWTGTELGNEIIEYVDESNNELPIPASGNILFKSDQESGIEFTSNLNNLNAVYSATKNTYEIKGARFSNDGFNWFTFDFLPNTNCPRIMGMDSQNNSVVCNKWDGSELTIPILEHKPLLQAEGRHSKYIEITDEKGNVSIASESFVYDITPPDSTQFSKSIDFRDILIGHFEYDLSNPEYTGKLKNYISFISTDSLSPVTIPGFEFNKNQVSGVEKIRFSFDNSAFSGWQVYEEGEVFSDILSWDNGIDGEVLKVFMQTQDRAGNVSEVFSDEIVLKHLVPQVSIIINNNEEYTSESTVALSIAVDSELEAKYMRFKYCNDTCEAEEYSSWIPFSKGVIDSLKDPLVNGEKNICIQIKDSAENISDESCDNIILDARSPNGSIKINNDSYKTNSTSVNLALTAEDPDLCNQEGVNCVPGSGFISYSLSSDQNNWSDWETCQGDDPTYLSCEINYNLASETGHSFVFVKYRDKAGNVSEVKSDSIILDNTTKRSSSPDEALFGGDIIINNDDVFTNSQVVALDISAFGSPTEMKIWNSNENPDEIERKPFQSLVYWKLDSTKGIKRVNIQFYKNGNASGIYFDEILLAQKYSADYNLREQVNNEILAYESFIIPVDIENTGSLTWQNAGENPVRASYHWYKKCELDSEVCTEESLYEWDGKRTNFSKFLYFNSVEQGLALEVVPPTQPGEYSLEIDLVHEGITWFSEKGVETLRLDFSVSANPNIPDEYIDSDSSEELPAYEGEYGIGSDTLDPLVENVSYSGGMEINGIVYTNNIWELYFHAKYVDPQPYPSGPEQAVFYIEELNSLPIDGQPEPVRKRILCAPIFTSSSSYNTINERTNRRALQYNNPAFWGTSFSRCVEHDRVERYFTDGVYRIGHQVMDKEHNKSYPSFHKVFVLDSNFDPENPPVTEEVVININNSYLTPIVPGTACGVGDAVDNDGLHVEVENWQNGFRLQGRLRLAGGDFSNWIELEDGILGRGIFEIIDNTASFLLTHEDDYPEGPAEWEVRVLSENGDLIGQIESLQFDVIRNLANTACGYSIVSDLVEENMGALISELPISVRMGPSFEFSEITRIGFGEIFEILQKTPEKTDPWYYIRLSDGTRGWIPGVFVDKNPDYNIPVQSPEEPLYQNAKVCNLDHEIPLKMASDWNSRDMYTGFSVSNTKLINNGDKILIIKELDDWYKVIASDDLTIGFIHKAYVCRLGSLDLEEIAQLDFEMPFGDASELTFPFAPRQEDFHYADDFGIPCNTPVKAVYGGTVKETGTEGIVMGNDSTSQTPANYVILSHSLFDSSGETLESHYWHLNEVWVNEGDQVAKGQLIGLSGNTGYVRGNPDHNLDKQGCHLHLEIHETQDDFARNPLHVLGENIAQERIDELKSKYLKDLNDKEIVNNLEYGTGSEVAVSDTLEVEVGVEFDKNGQLKLQYFYGKPSPPIITEVQVNPKKDTAWIYGVSTYKQAQFNLKVTYFDQTVREFRFYQQLDHVGIQLYKNRIGRDLELNNAFTWAEKDGNWAKKLVLGDELNVGDTIYARTKVWDSINNLAEGDELFRNFIYNIRYAEENEYMVSGKSNKEKILTLEDREIERKIEQAEAESAEECQPRKGMLDVCGNKYWEHIEELIERNIIHGYSDGNFYPKRLVTRGQTAKFIVNAFNLKIDTEGKRFPDVPEDHVFFEHIYTLRNKKIIQGYSDGTFKPDEYITKGQLAKILIEATNLYSCKNNSPLFQDVPRNYMFYKYIQSLGNYGVKEEGSMFYPDQQVQRDLMAFYVNMTRREFEDWTFEDDVEQGCISTESPVSFDVFESVLKETYINKFEQKTKNWTEERKLSELTKWINSPEEYQLNFNLFQDWLCNATGGCLSHGRKAAIDISMQNNTPLVSTINGTAYFRGKDSQGAYYVDVMNEKYQIRYLHLDPNTSNLYKQSKYKEVQKGELIAYSDNTGNTEGSHLHYEIFIKIPEIQQYKSTFSKKCLYVGAPDCEEYKGDIEELSKFLSSKENSEDYKKWEDDVRLQKFAYDVFKPLFEKGGYYSRYDLGVSAYYFKDWSDRVFTSAMAEISSRI
ncbi:peptidoglycan DD-metalloendopeptidase family protein [Candidatus Dojkabacteria bacterium]|nr:peptidoglycan DD-metalloendopeptidase family protein [Candidatus Dojkabacteria bacterium]